MTPEVATTTETTTSAIGNVRVYWRVSGLLLAAVALLGIILNAVFTAPYILSAEFLMFDWTHNVVHVVLAAIALTFGFGTFTESISKNAAKVVGIVYLALGVLGFVPAVVDALDTALALHIEWGENLVHIVVGAWGAYAGFTK